MKDLEILLFLFKPSYNCYDSVILIIYVKVKYSTKERFKASKKIKNNIDNLGV